MSEENQPATLDEFIKEKKTGYTGETDKLCLYIVNPSGINKVYCERGDDLLNDHIESLSFQDCMFKCPIILDGNNINGIAKITESFVEKEFRYIGGTISGELKFNSSCFTQKVSFQGVTFKGSVDFWDTKFIQELRFISCTFEEEVCFENTVFGSNVIFNECTFKSNVDFRLSDSYRDKVAKPYYHPMNCSFKDTTFKKKAIFYHRHFPECSFENTRFEGLVDFYNTRFSAETRFYKTDFIETAVFSKAVFSSAAVFHYTKVEKNLILRETSFNGGLNIAYINFIRGGFLELFGLDINSRRFRSVSTSPKYDIDKNDDWKIITHQQKRETYRILKHESIKQNNRIQALEYHAREMEAFRTELKSKGIKWYGDDRFVTEFNRLSNGYGLKWQWGLSWLFGISIVGFIVYWLSLLSPRPIIFTMDTTLMETVNSIGKVVGYYLQFTNPAHDIGFMEEHAGSWSYVLDIFVRLFIGLVIYQTIQAFRKYGRF